MLEERDSECPRFPEDYEGRDLEQYNMLLGLSCPKYCVNEACLLIDALNGSLPFPELCGYLWAQVEEAIELRRLAEKWDVDGDVLVARLRGQTTVQSLALLSAIKRYWSIYSDERTCEEMLVEVGLVEKP